MKRHHFLQRGFGLLAVAALLTAGTLPASAEGDNQKAYVLTMENGRGVTLPIPEEPAFWEYPTIPAGQQRVGGVLRLVNNSTLPVNLTLQEIALPYGDENALTYLDHLRIVVAQRSEATASAEEVVAPLSTTAPPETQPATEPAATDPTDTAVADETLPEDTQDTAAVETTAEPGTDGTASPTVETAPEETAAPQPWTQGETILYDGPYSRIAEEGGLELSVENLQPGEVREYTISLYCDFTYEGDPSLITQQVHWRFQASSSYTVAPEAPSPWDNPALPIVLGTAGGLMVLAILGAVIRSLVLRRRRKKDRLP